MPLLCRLTPPPWARDCQTHQTFAPCPWVTLGSFLCLNLCSLVACDTVPWPSFSNCSLLGPLLALLRSLNTQSLAQLPGFLHQRLTASSNSTPSYISVPSCSLRLQSPPCCTCVPHDTILSSTLTWLSPGPHLSCRASTEAL